MWGYPYLDGAFLVFVIFAIWALVQYIGGDPKEKQRPHIVHRYYRKELDGQFDDLGNQRKNHG